MHVRPRYLVRHFHVLHLQPPFPSHLYCARAETDNSELLIVLICSGNSFMEQTET